jgi:hypothetical protein
MPACFLFILSSSDILNMQMISHMEVHSIDTQPMQVVPVTKRRNSYLDYYKTILEKVSFDGQLFNKEYRKARNRLSEEEVASLDDWIRSKSVC